MINIAKYIKIVFPICSRIHMNALNNKHICITKDPVCEARYINIRTCSKNYKIPIGYNSPKLHRYMTRTTKSYDTNHSPIATKVKLKPKKLHHSKRKGQP